MIIYVCEYCNSSNIRQSAWTKWNKKTKKWELYKLEGFIDCCDCGEYPLQPIKYEEGEVVDITLENIDKEFAEDLLKKAKKEQTTVSKFILNKIEEEESKDEITATLKSLKTALITYDIKFDENQILSDILKKNLSEEQFKSIRGLR